MVEFSKPYSHLRGYAPLYIAVWGIMSPALKEDIPCFLTLGIFLIRVALARGALPCLTSVE